MKKPKTVSLQQLNELVLASKAIETHLEFLAKEFKKIGGSNWQQPIENLSVYLDHLNNVIATLEYEPGKHFLHSIKNAKFKWKKK